MDYKIYVGHELYWVTKFIMELGGVFYHKHQIVRFKKVPHIIQINIAGNYDMRNIVVNMKEFGYKKFSIRIGTKVMAKANTFQSALNYFKEL